MFGVSFRVAKDESGHSLGRHRGRAVLAEETHDFAQSLLGDPSISEAVASHIAKESGGNPYFAVELARYASRFSVEEARALGADSLRIDHLLRDRIADLENDRRQLLQVVAVHSQPLARPMPIRPLDSPAAIPPRSMLCGIANLVRSTGFNQADHVESFHDRVRDAVLRSHVCRSAALASWRFGPDA